MNTKKTSSFPSSDMEMTVILVVTDLERSKSFYSNVLGAEFFREYAGTSAVYKFQGVWLLLSTAGGPTPDKPNVSFAPPVDGSIVNHSFTIRVSNCQFSYETLLARGANFLTPPYTWDNEVRCFFKDPDGHLFEISEYKQSK